MNFLLLLHIKACLAYIKYINKNIFNNFLIAESRRTRTHLFKKLPNPAPAPAPESRNAPVLHSIQESEFCSIWIFSKKQVEMMKAEGIVKISKAVS